MYLRAMFLLAAGAATLVAEDAMVAIRAQEYTLTKALAAKDKTAVLELTDKDFRIDWTEHSPERFFNTEIGREDWIDNLTRLRIQLYRATVSKISVTREQATVKLNECWQIRSSTSGRIEKRFSTTDIWLRREGTWKLMRRYSQATPR